eukprot:8638628-Alexandrium_andersonii.AAC.1
MASSITGSGTAVLACFDQNPAYLPSSLSTRSATPSDGPSGGVLWARAGGVTESMPRLGGRVGVVGAASGRGAGFVNACTCK